MFRTLSGELGNGITLDLPEINFAGVKIEKDHGALIGKPIKEIHLREKSGINLVAIKRDGETETEITGDTKLKLGDIVYVVGRPDALGKFEEEVGIS